MSRRIRELRCDKPFPIGEVFVDESTPLFSRMSQYLEDESERASFFAVRAEGGAHEKPGVMQMAGLRGYAKSFTNVYFIVCGSTGSIKIGRADNVERRLRELQVSNAGELAILGFFRAPSSFENFLHCLFARSHRRGEWFSITDDLLDLVEDGVEKNYIGALSRSKAILITKKPLTC
ncbi:hypothetical protein D3C77_382230 [compost metagenome]